MLRNTVKSLIGFVLVAGLGLGLSAATRPGPAPADIQTDDAKAYQQAYNFILSEKWTEAEKALSDFLRTYPESRWSDDARYWQCYLMEKKGAGQEAVFNCYKSFVDDNPSSDWADDARANMVRIGRALAKAGRGEYAAMLESMQKGEDEEVALAALYALSDRGDARARDAIITLYDQSSSRRVRSEIAGILAEDESPQALAKLKDIVLKDPDEEIRRDAVSAMGERRDSADFLRQIAGSSRDREAQEAALRVLAEQNDPQVIPIIKKLAAGADPSDESQVSLAQEAVEALGEMKGPDSLAALQQIFKEARATEIREAALEGLAERKDGLSLAALRDLALNDADDAIRGRAIDLIAERKGPEPFNVLKDIYEKSKEDETRSSALDAIAELGGDKAVDFLLTIALSSVEDEIARDAVNALGDVEKADTEKLYLEIYRKAKSAEARREAVSDLIDDKKEQAIEFIRGILKEEPDPALRETAVSALGEIKTDASVAILLNAAKNDKDISVRTTAVASLGEIGTPKAREALMEILKKKNPNGAL